MRTAHIALIAATGIGLAAASTTSAAPVSGLVLSGQAAPESVIVDVSYCRNAKTRRGKQCQPRSTFAHSIAWCTPTLQAQGCDTICSNSEGFLDCHCQCDLSILYLLKDLWDGL
jgi:hypothetical protein